MKYTAGFTFIDIMIAISIFGILGGESVSIVFEQLLPILNFFSILSFLVV